jgi:hypothetical protein
MAVIERPVPDRRSRPPRPSPAPLVLSDFRLALRSLRRAPAFSILSIAALALGIGATTTVFSVVDRVLLSPLGYDDAERLVALSSADSSRIPGAPPSYLDVMDWRAQATTFTGMAFVRGATPLLRGPEGSERMLTAYVTGGFFELLGVRALRGRTFLAEEERGGGAPVIVLGHDFWMTRFGGDPAAVGRAVDLGSGSATIVGVLPPTGMALALGAVRVLTSLVFGVSVTDPATFAAVAATLMAVALLASWIPAQRAARTDPVEALRME